LVRARTALINTARGVTKSYGERLRGCNARNVNPEKAEGLSPELQAALEPLLAAVESLSEQIPEYNQRIEQFSAAELSASGAVETGEGSGHADRTYLLADVGGSASLSQEPRRRLLSGAATRTAQLGAKRTATAHQQAGRSVSKNAAGAGSASTFWDRSEQDSDLRRWG